MAALHRHGAEKVLFADKPDRNTLTPWLTSRFRRADGVYERGVPVFARRFGNAVRNSLRIQLHARIRSKRHTHDLSYVLHYCREVGRHGRCYQPMQRGKFARTSAQALVLPSPAHPERQRAWRQHQNGGQRSM